MIATSEQKKDFAPVEITLTLQSQYEVNALWAITGCSPSAFEEMLKKTEYNIFTWEELRGVTLPLFKELDKHDTIV